MAADKEICEVMGRLKRWATPTLVARLSEFNAACVSQPTCVTSPAFVPAGTAEPARRRDQAANALEQPRR